MRLDNLISKSLGISRAESKKLIAKGGVKVNGLLQKSKNTQVKDSDAVVYGNEQLEFPERQYLMLNKPKGYICSTVDEVLPSSLQLINIRASKELHFAGRLDADTTGLVLISDDGQWTHRITSPKYKQPKRYLVKLEKTISVSQISELESGVKLKDSDKRTLPASVSRVSDRTIRLTIVEGRYHQVKRMIAAVGNRVEELHREAIGPLELEPSLAVGHWRKLTSKELSSF